MATKKASDETISSKEEDAKDKLICGIVMPISSIDSCSAEHWKDVQDILKDAISSAGFTARLVSESDDSGIIQKRIIQNLYSDPIVVCDVSGKNPNVMFELGMRLAFDKPTIVVKDDKTDYSFDTSPIEHILYPRDLRFNSIVKFKEDLTDKVKGTYTRANKDKDYTTFLKHFGKFKVAELDEQVLGKEDYILNSIDDLRDEIRRMSIRNRLNRESLFERDNDQKYSLVKSKVRAFLKKYGIIFNDLNEKNKESVKEDLFHYLRSIPDVQNVCEGPADLRETLDLVL